MPRSNKSTTNNNWNVLNQFFDTLFMHIENSAISSTYRDDAIRNLLKCQYDVRKGYRDMNLARDQSTAVSSVPNLSVIRGRRGHQRRQSKSATAQAA
jgi:hypothetical protein